MHIEDGDAALQFIACVQQVSNQGFIHHARFGDFFYQPNYVCRTERIHLELREADLNDRFLSYDRIFDVMNELLESTEHLSGFELYAGHFEVWDLEEESRQPLRRRLYGTVEVSPPDGSSAVVSM